MRARQDVLHLLVIVVTLVMEIRENILLRYFFFFLMASVRARDSGPVGQWGGRISRAMAGVDQENQLASRTGSSYSAQEH